MGRGRWRRANGRDYVTGFGGEPAPRIAHRRCAPCGKLLYSSEREAKLAHRTAGYRIRAYYCSEGGGWHVMNVDKSRP